ncbi:MAG: CAP domain-containing protein [Thermoflexibacter sp.]|jgi:uncharacterized protein YkwD|nr:CAP domain-containing protein [Thermoflexibacter sp.]
MSKILKINVLIIFLFSFFVVTSYAQVSEEKAIAQKTLQLINNYRQSKGLPPFVEQTLVYESALEHSMSMARSGRMNHQNFDKRIKKLSKTLKVGASAENVAFNEGLDNPAEMAFQQWKESQGHNRNMLDRTYTHTGLAVTKTKQGAYYFTQIFIQIR